LRRLVASILAFVILAPASWIGAAVGTVPADGCRATRERISLSPEKWPAGEVEKYMKLEQEWGGNPPLAEGAKGAVCGTSGVFAVRAGLEALKQGGSAADAAMATSLAQVALTTGWAISFAGIMTMVYYDAASRKIYSMNAGYNTVREEDDPLTIPKMGSRGGRTALVPGFMAGVQAAHTRFGKLPLASIFDPAIYIAEQGFPLAPVLAGAMASQKDVITRLPETKAVFTKGDGGLYSRGDVFKQPKLAETLRRVASRGADYIYKGEWARHFVDAVTSEGGKVTMQDMAGYKAIWSEPLQTTYNEYSVASLGMPSDGGLNTIEAFNLLEAATFKKMGSFAASAESLYWLMQITHFALYAQFLPADLLQKYLPGVSLAPDARVKKENAKLLFERMHEPGWQTLVKSIAPPEEDPKHSAAVVAVDEKGNVAAVVHSINTVAWGSTGIFVDGISIPDSACFQQELIKKVGPGVRLPDPTNPIIVLRGGKPVLASSSIGSGLHMATMQNMVNILDFGMDPKKSVDSANFLGPFVSLSRTGFGGFNLGLETVWAGEFPRAVIDGVRARGQKVEIFEKGKPGGPAPGYWIGIKLDPANHRLQGAVTPALNGRALAY
jgi:gamma-glutamyltranspeptidase/glutathione hydrolase